MWQRAIFCCLVLLSGQGLTAGGLETQTQSQDDAGVTTTLRYSEQGDGAGLAQVSLTDSASGLPVQGARPAAWMVMRRSEQVSSERHCEDMAKSLMSGSLGARADVDLNSYRLVTLNHDQTLAFINPHVGLQRSKLESIVQLPAQGFDWVQVPQSSRILVSLRDAAGVALVDTSTRQLMRVIATGASSLPTRLMLDTSGQRVWVGLDGSQHVLALDARTGQELARVNVGRGSHQLSLGKHWLFSSNSDANSVTVIDADHQLAMHEVPVGAAPVDAAWSDAAQRLAVLSSEGARVDLLDPQAGRVTTSIQLAPGVVRLGLFAGGRFALVLNGHTAMVSLLDLASARVLAEVAVAGQPDQLVFSRDFAYVRSQTSAIVSVINLAQAQRGALTPIAVAMGRAAPIETPHALNVADVLAPTPEGNGMFVANAGDGAVYRYAEGMMVPVGSFSNYRRAARGLMVLDGSLSERSTGAFEALARVETAGRYDFVVRNLRPSVLACFTLTVNQGLPKPAGESTPSPPRISNVLADAGDKATVRLSWQDATGQPVDVSDLVLLAMQRNGQWQQRAAAYNEGGGSYRVPLRGLRAGETDLLVRSESKALTFDQGHLGKLQWPLSADRPMPVVP